MCAWLKQCQVTDLGRESTGVYGKPVWNALEGKWVGTFRIRNPCSFPKAKLYPAGWQPELRDLTRLGVRLKQEVARATNRILKVLEDAQIQSDCVTSDPLGLPGRLLLDRWVKGEIAPAELTDLAPGNLKKKKAQFGQALAGNFTEHHRFRSAAREGGPRIRGQDL